MTRSSRRVGLGRLYSVHFGTPMTSARMLETYTTNAGSVDAGPGDKVAPSARYKETLRETTTWLEQAEHNLAALTSKLEAFTVMQARVHDIVKTVSPLIADLRACVSRSGPMTCGPSSACSTRESAGDTYLPLNASGNGDLSDDQIEELKQKYIGRLGNERVDLQRKWWISEVRRR